MRTFLQTSEKIGNFHFWRRVTNFWTFIFLTAIVYDYANKNILADNDTLLAIAGIYCAALAIYSTEKEFRRWHHMHSSMHPGEFYAIIWTVFVIVIIGIQAFLNFPYHMPSEVSASYIAVISILAITRESKNLYKKNRKV